MSPGRWRPAPPVFARFPAAPLAVRWRTWLEATWTLVAPPPVPYDSPAYWDEAQEVLRGAGEQGADAGAKEDRG